MPTAASALGRRLSSHPAVAVWAATVAFLLTACGGGGELPDRVGASLVLRGSAVDTPVLRLNADIGGGCNVDGPYTLSTEVDRADHGTTVTITGHDYRSDGGECAEIASAEAEVELPTLPAGDQHQLEIRLDEQPNTFVLVAADTGMVVTERSSDNVLLVCRDRDEVPTEGCTIPVDG